VQASAGGEGKLCYTFLGKGLEKAKSTKNQLPCSGSAVRRKVLAGREGGIGDASHRGGMSEHGGARKGSYSTGTAFRGAQGIAALVALRACSSDGKREGGQPQTKKSSEREGGGEALKKGLITIESATRERKGRSFSWGESGESW